MARYFDSDLPKIGSDKIKLLAKLWGGNAKMRKEECLACISAGLRDPERVRAAIESLQPWERNALALIKHMGGVITNHALKIGLLASGLHIRRASSYRDEFVDDLFRRGLILAVHSYDPEPSSSSYENSVVYSDERLLAHIGQPEYLPLEILPREMPGEIHYRRPSAVAMDIMGLLDAIDGMGGIKITQSGSVRASEESKLRKAMRWPSDSLDIDGFPFSNPAQAWIEAFRYSDILKDAGGNQLALAVSISQFAARPFGEQIRMVMEGVIRTKAWWETPPAASQFYMDPYGNGRQQGRMAMALAISALPLNSAALFSVKDFEQALYQRIGEDFALDYPPQRPYFRSRSTREEQKQELTVWQETTRAKWLKQEYPWILRVFTSWLYFLGLVQLMMEGEQLIGFRLTDIGRQAFHPELAPTTTPEADPLSQTQPAWVVQPNFDVVVYLDRVNTPQLAFLERHAERTQAHKNTALYQLTRDSVYRGLESGTTLDELLATLQKGSQVELSQNVIVELREWASLRDRIVLRKSAKLLEFTSAQALQSAISAGLEGKVIAERFLLLESAQFGTDWNSINYASPLPQNLKATETGQIHWKRSPNDLVTVGLLTQWAQPMEDDQWQLTQESVTAALKPGRKITDLLDLLTERVKSVPPLLTLALRSWTSVKQSVQLETVIILNCPQEQVFQVIVSSPLMLSYLRGYNYPSQLFVIPERLDALRLQLEWLGLIVTDHLTISPIVIRPS